MSFILPFMVAFFLLPFTQKFLQTAERLPEWDLRLKYARYGAFGLLGIQLITDVDFISPTVFFLLLLLVAFPAYLLKNDVSHARLLLWMIVPVGIVFLIDNLAGYWTPKFHKTNDGLFEAAKGIAITAGFVLALMARSQQKELAKEHLKLEQEEENNRILEAKKLDLEYQVAERTAELVRQKEELERALEHLKATQEQLIQSEKLASLGELTAGIAHEIQNPLNFVNNFSELSVELAEELQEALRHKGIEASSEEGELLSDLIQNQAKINHHGKRASSIVKGMLEHSRASTGVRELTDINQLADEYLRLSYHGLRAKDNNGSTPRFNADYELIVDESLPKIEVIPQDIGRVLLNIINNAFYATNAVRVLNPDSVKNAIVKVITEKSDNQIIIKIFDNGIGMTDEVKAKIFQPFFTTKPTGQGTGLGLSLAYDIVTKGHGGMIEVESVEGEGTTFTVCIPYSNV